ncbi:hypothetical protein JCM8547_005649 [Rhodosporidiobolus lusitaniae]
MASLSASPPPPSLQDPPDSLLSVPQAQHDEVKADGLDEVDTTADLIAGWLGGAVGVIVGNPFEVLKVRLQTAFTHGHGSSSSSHPSSHHPSPSHSSPRVGKSSVPPLPSPAFPFPKPPAPLPSALPSVSSPSPTSTVRAAPPISSVSPSSAPSPSAGAPKPPAVGLLSLYRTEGIRFFFAGTAGPILGLAFIDSAFFGLYGRAMQQLGQDRQDPNALSLVFLSGATAGALCALLETPIEVVKTRAQVESPSSHSSHSHPSSSEGKKLGSFKIASQIARTEGLRGFYVGGLMTAAHDAIASGIFFASYFVLRRALRGDNPFSPASSSSSSSSSFPASQPSPLESLASSTFSSPSSSSSVPLAHASASASLDTPSPPRRPLADEAGATSAREEEEQEEVAGGGMGKGEVGRILVAGGLAGAISAVVPYPFDIVKTRLQTANFASRSRSSPLHPSSAPPSSPANFTSNATPFHSRPPSAPGAGGGEKQTIRSVFRGIHAEGVAAYRYKYPSTWVYQTLSTLLPSPSSSSSGGTGGALNPRAEKWALRLLGFKGFTTGLGPTVVSSFVGSAATITTVELALHFMGVNGGGGGVG